MRRRRDLELQVEALTARLLTAEAASDHLQRQIVAATLRAEKAEAVSERWFAEASRPTPEQQVRIDAHKAKGSVDVIDLRNIPDGSKLICRLASCGAVGIFEIAEPEPTLTYFYDMGCSS